MIPQRFIEGYLRFLLKYKKSVALATALVTLFFDAQATALFYGEPGTYRWTIDVDGANVATGLSVVESYSDEYPPRPVVLRSQAGSGGLALVVDYARERWWLFALAILALVAEWGWRQRRGLP